MNPNQARNPRWSGGYDRPTNTPDKSANCQYGRFNSLSTVMFVNVLLK